jgi:hypothetical protein
MDLLTFFRLGLGSIALIYLVAAWLAFGQATELGYARAAVAGAVVLVSMFSAILPGKKSAILLLSFGIVLAAAAASIRFWLPQLDLRPPVMPMCLMGISLWRIVHPLPPAQTR